MYNKDFNKKVQGIAGMAERMMLDYSWPGNVRELKNVIERAIILGNDESLLMEHLPLEIVAKAHRPRWGTDGRFPSCLRKVLILKRLRRN